ncbi:MAG: GNAT family N-acetyltransferase [Waterburya sp.]
MPLVLLRFALFSRHWGGWVSSAFRHDFNADETTMILCNAQTIGYYSLKENCEGVYLQNLQLSSVVQGKGIGTEVLKNILNSNKLKSIRLTTFLDNPAIHLYQRLGFIITKHNGATVNMTRYPQ